MGRWGIFKWPQVGDFGWPSGLIHFNKKYYVLQHQGRTLSRASQKELLYMTGDHTPHFVVNISRQ
jgi:hypothetical protein